MANLELLELDRSHLIHSAVSWSTHERRGATILSSSDGVFLVDTDNRRLLDAFAGLWCVNAGYGHQSVVAAAAEQMARLPYATGYFHYASEAAVRLATALAQRAPGDLNHVFFTLGGSDAVDGALRFIRYYSNITGRPNKKHIISLDRGYHGSSALGSGVTGLHAFHANFDSPTELQHHLPCAYPYRADVAGDGELIAQSVAALKAKVEALGAENVAAFFAEPVIGSGGVIVPPDGWYRAMRETCRQLEILFVADEVITGFGRTGPLFGSSHDDVAPDIMTLAKGLTSGYAPMGAILLSDRIYQTIADCTDPGTVIGHGLTYSGHPVSAAVGLEVLRLYEDGGIIANGQKVAPHLHARLESLIDHPLVGDVRARGLLAGIELVTDKRNKTRPASELQIPDHLTRISYRNGLIIRSFSDSIIGIAPPLCITSDEIDLLADLLERTLDEILELPDVRAALAR